MPPTCSSGSEARGRASMAWRPSTMTLIASSFISSARLSPSPKHPRHRNHRDGPRQQGRVPAALLRLAWDHAGLPNDNSDAPQWVDPLLEALSGSKDSDLVYGCAAMRSFSWSAYWVRTVKGPNMPLKEIEEYFEHRVPGLHRTIRACI